MIAWSSMTVAQRARSMRLLAILKSTFSQHPRTCTLVNAFVEGVSLVSLSFGATDSSQEGNGFELLRQLTIEYSLRTRNEALMFRTSLATKSFKLEANETSPSSLVSDVIRKLDLEAARFQKLLLTLPAGIDAVGLQLTDADLLTVLIRSLPEQVKALSCTTVQEIPIWHTEKRHGVGSTINVCFRTCRRRQVRACHRFRTMLSGFGLEMMANLV